MARVKVRGKGAHGDFEIEIDLEDERVAELVRQAVHGHSVTITEVAPEPPEDRGNDSPDSHPSRDDQKRVYHVPGGYVPLTEEEATEFRSRLPDRKGIAKIILDQPGRRHSLPSITQAVFGRTVTYASPTHGEKRLFFMLQGRIVKARRLIEKADSMGKFVLTENRVGRSRVYEWRRD